MSPLRVFVALMIVLAMIGVWMTQRDTIREHRLYFTEDRKDVGFKITDISEEWTEKSLRERFSGVPLNCYPNPGDDLGDLACALDTKSFNGVPALFISFFFKSGHLRQVSINVPWWKHQMAYDYLVSSLGRKTASQLFPVSGVRLHGWSLPNGAAVFYNRDKSLSPLQWNAINWQSAALCEARGCFMSQRKKVAK